MKVHEVRILIADDILGVNNEKFTLCRKCYTECTEF